MFLIHVFLYAGVYCIFFIIQQKHFVYIYELKAASYDFIRELT